MALICYFILLVRIIHNLVNINVFMQDGVKNCKKWTFTGKKVDVPLFSAAARPPVKNKKAQHKNVEQNF